MDNGDIVRDDVGENVNVLLPVKLPNELNCIWLLVPPGFVELILFQLRIPVPLLYK